METVYANDAFSEDAGNKKLAAEQYLQSYELLSPCEDKPDLSFVTPNSLARIYFNFDFHGKGEVGARRRGWIFRMRAAAAGDIEAAKSLVLLYRDGDRLLNVPANPNRERCFEDLGAQER